MTAKSYQSTSELDLLLGRGLSYKVDCAIEDDLGQWQIHGTIKP